MKVFKYHFAIELLFLEGYLNFKDELSYLAMNLA